MVVGDAHNDNRQPPARSDDYQAACLQELNEVVDIANEANLDYVLFLGDLFHRIDPSGSCRNGVIRALQRCNKRKLIVPGNHDVANSLDRLMDSALGTLILDQHLEFKEYFDEFKLGILPYKEGVHQDIMDGDATRYPAVVWAAHAYIVPTKFFDASHVIFDDMPVNPECKLVLAGHLHLPMEVIREDGVCLINPGSIGRPKASAEHLGRQPQVLMLKYNTDGSSLQHKYVPLECSKPAEEVFFLETVRENRVNRKKAREFIKQMSQVGTWVHGADKYVSLRESAKQKGVSDEVVTIAETALREANDRKND
ncbi:MAG: metallophosphoesterase family protein [Armatimonadetes bacterium]|nr:metallophosphoesterase family protein [Armatimonadota bacterium]